MKDLNIKNIPKPYSLKKTWAVFVYFYKIFYEDCMIREGYSGITGMTQVEDEVFLLNAAYLEGWLKGAVYGID